MVFQSYKEDENNSKGGNSIAQIGSESVGNGKVEGSNPNGTRLLSSALLLHYSKIANSCESKGFLPISAYENLRNLPLISL